MTRRLAIAAIALALAACDEMNQQPRYDHYEKSTLFPNGTSLQTPPEGTIGRDDPAEAAALADQPPITEALLHRGAERYGIHCTPCHDQAGTGHGTVPGRGFPAPPSFHIQRLRDAPARYFVDVITHGHGVMYSYADRVSSHDRWAIAAYIRALQMSHNAPVAALTDEERRKLDEAAR
jgi:mono/diheme cytochrome c family protein